MDHSQLPLFDPNSIAYGNAGFTSPGSQLQESFSGFPGQEQLESSLTFGDSGLFLLPETELQSLSSGPQGQQLVQSNLGFNNGIDAGSAFDRMFQQVNSGKRTSLSQFSNDANIHLHKRQTLQGQQPGSMQTMLNSNIGNVPSVPSSTTWANQASSTNTPAFQQLSLGSGRAASPSVPNPRFHNQSNPAHVSPYGTGAHQQAPAFQETRAGNEMPNQEFLTRFRAYERRITLLTEKLNRYENALRPYTTPDPATGKVPMRALKDEITALRQCCSTFKDTEKQYKAQLQDWQTKYATVAKLYEQLRLDFNRMRGLYQAKCFPPTPESAASATPAPGPVTGSVAGPVSEPVAGPLPGRVAAPVAGPVAGPMDSNVYGHGFSNKANPIDLTIGGDDDTETTTVNPSDASNAQSGNAFNDFRRSFKQKELKWLQPTHPSDALQDLYDKLNPRDKEGYVDYVYGNCWEMVETQKRVRGELGGAFNQAPAPRREESFYMPGLAKPTAPSSPRKSATPPKPTTPPKQTTTPKSTTSSKTQSTGSGSGGKKKKLALMTPDEIFAEDPTKDHIGQEEIDELFEEMEASFQQEPAKDTEKDDYGYHVAEEELVQMLEAEMRKTVEQDPVKDAEKDDDDYHVTDEELAQMLEDEMRKTVEQDPPQDSAMDDDLDSLFEE